MGVAWGGGLQKLFFDDYFSFSNQRRLGGDPQCLTPVRTSPELQQREGKVIGGLGGGP